MKILIVTETENDLSEIFAGVCNAEIITPEYTGNIELSLYDCAAILGGAKETPLILNAYLREQLEEFAKSGKKVFTEYVNSFGCVYSAAPKTMTPHRLVCCGDIEGIQKGELLDSCCNNYIHPHFLMPNTVSLMYYREFTPAHNRLKNIDGDNFTDTLALFYSGNVLSAAFRMSNCFSGGFTPKKLWINTVNYICSFLGLPTPTEYPKCKTDICGEIDTDFNVSLENCISSAMALLKEYLVTPDGKRGIREGLSHNISPDGKRTLATNVRADCTGEAAGVFLMSDDAVLNACGDNMLGLCYGPLTVKGGDFDGMMRWTEEAWEVCYQDDVARAVIPSLLLAVTEKNKKHVKNACRALEFLCSSTCKDGLRPARTDVLEFIKNGKSVKSLADEENGFKSAHYNSWYSAALLLGYMASGNEHFKQLGIKGLESLMSVYPETVREHSETSELCRLIFPLAVMYKVSGESKHKAYLEKVFSDLLTHKHPCGGYAEWDTGYKAACFNNAGGECSLLSENGDNVADLLYSLNWLPMGFAFAYYATKEKKYFDAWKDICTFFVKTQIVSDNKYLNGGWCRGIDLDTLEYRGVPHDVGWGPCSLETGWTVSEITMGMLFGKDL